MAVSDEYTDEGTNVAQDFGAGRLNLYKDILDEQKDLGIAASKYGTNQSVGSLLGNYGLPLAMNFLFPGSSLLTSTVGKAAMGGVGSIVGGGIGGGLTRDRYRDLLRKKGGRFLGSDREELRAHMDESLYAQSIKNAIQSGAIDALGLDRLKKDPGTGTDVRDMSGELSGYGDLTGEGEVNILDIVDANTMTRSEMGLGNVPLSIPTEEKTGFFERMRKKGTEVETPEISDTTFKDNLGVAAQVAGTTLDVGAIPRKGWEGLKGLVDELKNMEMYKTVIDEAGNRVKVPIGTKSQKDLTPGFLGSGVNLKDIRLPKLERTRPRVAVPQREKVPFRDRLQKTVVDEQGNRVQVPIGTKSADRGSLAERLGFRLNPATQRLLGRESTMNISPEMSGLIDIITSGEWTSEDLIQFQELSGLEPTGNMDMETTNMLRTIGR